MRLMPVSLVKEGQILARSLLSEQGHLLLRQGTPLNRSLAQRIQTLGYQFVHIVDQYSPEDYEEVIKPQVSQSILRLGQSMTELVAETQPDGKKLDAVVSEMRTILDSVIDDITGNADVLSSLLSISSYDEATYKHSLNMMVLAVVVGSKLRLSRPRLVNLATGCIFHDVGKLFIPKDTLLKPSRLNDEEYRQVQAHSREGYEFLRTSQQLSPTSRILSLEHHEHWDGTGYPDGKVGEDIHLFSRIASVCDVFEALTADRPYRRGWPPGEAREFVLGGGGAHFDLKVVQAFASAVNPYPRESIVRLSDDREGIVREIHPGRFTHPVVEIFYQGRKRVTPCIVDLAACRNITIVDVMPLFSAEQPLLDQSEEEAEP